MQVKAAQEALTEHELSEVAYLVANPDGLNAGMAAREHLVQQGRTESREQLSGEALARVAKYARFRAVLAPSLDQPGRTFPIVCGRGHFDLSDYATESANPGFGPFEDEVINNPNGLYLDLGCGYRERTFPNCLYLEVYPSRSADLVVEPNCRYPIRSGSLDGIGCFAVLEHTRQPWLVVSEIQRMLRPGGRVFIDWPFLQPVHGYPSHFFNATREGLVSLFDDNGFSVEMCTTGAHQSPAYTIRWVLGAMAARLPEGELRLSFAQMTVGEVVALDVQGETWRRFLSALEPAAISELACGNILVASKPDPSVLTHRDETIPKSSTMPPVDLRERVSGTRDEAEFDRSGRRTVDEWRRALASSGLALETFSRVIDFGCGCGRAMRFLPEYLAPGYDLVGLDTDAEAIAWLAATMPGVTVRTLDPMPPVPMADASVDLVLSHSVFTHLPENVQFDWLEELHRLLSPGGILVTSVHGRKALVDFLRSLSGTPLEPTGADIRGAMDDKGFYHLFGKTEAERSYPQYYGAAFHDISYITRTWSRWFDLVAWYPAFALDLQDVVVMRSKYAA